jgi:hypothetical protein
MTRSLIFFVSISGLFRNLFAQISRMQLKVSEDAGLAAIGQLL